MDEATTTSAEPDELLGEPVSQPDTPDQATAEATTEETQPTQTGDVEDTVEATAETDENVQWLKNKGIDPSDPEAIRKAAELARNTEREFHKSRQEASTKLKDAANDAAVTGDPVSDALNALAISNNVRDFKDALRDEGLTRAEIDAIDEQMAEIVTTKPHLAGDLETAYALVKVGKAKDAIAAAEARGREAAKAEIARASTATMPKGNASGNAPTEKPDPGLEAFETAFNEGL